MKTNYKLWPFWPYAGELKPPTNPVEPLAGSWPMYYLNRDKEGNFTDLWGNYVKLYIKNPNTVNWCEQLHKVIKTAACLTPHQITIAKYWGTGVPTKQWTPIIDRLIDTYNLSPPKAARVMAAVQAGINDALVVTWYLKYKWMVARPNQYDNKFASILCTPRFPAYPSGHSAMAGCAEIILSYFLPREQPKLKELAEECAASRLYAGVHFPVDNDEGLRLGRQIGYLAVHFLKNQKNAIHKPVDDLILQDYNAVLQPPPYKQAIPFKFCSKCQSKVKI